MSIRMPSKSGSSAGGPRVLTKKDVTDLEAAGVKLRRQMDVHVTCLDARSTSKVEVVQEWHEYLKKRAEIELEYTKSLDKLSDRTIEKISRLKKSSKENSLNGCSSTPIDLLLTMVTDNKQLASRRGLLCDDITNEVLPRLDVVSKDISISTRRVKEGFHVAHEEIKKAHTDLLESMKAYMAACVASEESQSKLSKIQSSRSKGKNVDKDAKKEIKMLEGLMSNKFKAITCRNEYIMCLEWFNKICRTYFKRWSADLLEFFDFDFHNSIRNVQRLHGSLEKNYLALNTQFIDSWQKQLSELSAKADLRKFQAANMGAFPIPQDVPFVPYGPNEKHSLYAVSGVYEGMASQRGDLTMQIGQTTFRLDEAHRSLQEVKESFLKSQETVFGSSIEECLEENAKSTGEKQKNQVHMTSTLSSVLASRREHHDTLCSQFNKVVEFATELSKKYTTSDLLEEYLKELSDTDIKKNTQSLATETLKPDDTTQQTLSHLDKYMMENNNRIPPIVTSCIQFIEQNGPTIEGVFRVPGIVSQIEEMREQFIDEDKDPLFGNEEQKKTYDIHAVGSLLKQYLRDLPEPVFPFSTFQRIVDVQTKTDQQERVNHLSEIMKDLPEGRRIVLREIMRFLDHFSEHALATKMNRNNLALVFGPTLLAAPADMDAITLAQHTTSINLVTLLMVENRGTIFGEPETIEPPAPVEETVETPSLSRLELRKLQPILYNQLENSLLHSVFSGLRTSETAPASVIAAPSSVIAAPSSVIAAPSSEMDETLSKIVAGESSRSGSVTSSKDAPVASAPQSESEAEAAEKKAAVLNRFGRSQSALQHSSLQGALSKALAAESLNRKRLSVPSLSIKESGDSNQGSSSPGADTGTANSPEPSPLLDRRRSSPGVRSLSSSPTKEPCSGGQEAGTEPMKPLEKAESPKADTQSVPASPSASPSVSSTQQVKASHAYTARTAKELTFQKGAVIDVFSKSPDGNWWDSMLDGKRGYVPVSYVKTV